MGVLGRLLAEDVNWYLTSLSTSMKAICLQYGNENRLLPSISDHVVHISLCAGHHPYVSSNDSEADSSYEHNKSFGTTS